MSEYDWDFQDDDDDQPIDPRSLPKQLRTVIRDAKKEAKEAREEAAALRKQVRESTIESVLAEAGVSRKVAKLIPVDVDTSAEAIKMWLTDYSDVFTPSSSTPANEQATTGEQVTSNGQAFINAATSPSGDEIAAMQRMQNTAQTAQPFGGRGDELMAKLNDPDLTIEQLDTLVAKGGL